MSTPQLVVGANFPTGRALTFGHAESIDPVLNALTDYRADLFRA